MSPSTSISLPQAGSVFYKSSSGSVTFSVRGCRIFLLPSWHHVIIGCLVANPNSVHALLLWVKTQHVFTTSALIIELNSGFTLVWVKKNVKLFICTQSRVGVMTKRFPCFYKHHRVFFISLICAFFGSAVLLPVKLISEKHLEACLNSVKKKKGCLRRKERGGFLVKLWEDTQEYSLRIILKWARQINA